MHVHDIDMWWLQSALVKTFKNNNNNTTAQHYSENRPELERVYDQLTTRPS